MRRVEGTGILTARRRRGRVGRAKSMRRMEGILIAWRRRGREGRARV
jgi:hypothetical protein